MYVCVGGGAWNVRSGTRDHWNAERGRNARTRPAKASPHSYDRKLWKNVKVLQSGLVERGFDIGTTKSCVTPVFLKGDMLEAMVLVKDLREKYGVFCSIVVYPLSEPYTKNIKSKFLLAIINKVMRAEEIFLSQTSSLDKTLIYQTIRDRFRYHINNNACHQSFMKQFLFEMKLNTIQWPPSKA